MTSYGVGQIEKVGGTDGERNMVGVVVGACNGVQPQILAVAQRVEMQSAAIEDIVFVAQDACRYYAVAYFPFVAVAEHVFFAVAIFVTALNEKFGLVVEIVYEFARESHLLVEKSFCGVGTVHIIEFDGETAYVETVTQ